MAIKANASSNGDASFKKYVGVGSFRVLGVNFNKAELEKFYEREMDKEPSYLSDAVDEKDNNKAYKRLRVSFAIQADLNYEDEKPIKDNTVLTEPFKTTVNFFIDSRYNYNSDKSKVQVIDKYGRTAWVTVEQAKNKQIPVYSNGPARISADYRPAYRGEEALLQFILNYLNVTPIDTYNSNTGTWETNKHPEDCEGSLEHIKDYFKGDVSELKSFCTLIPTNRVKLLVGVRTDNEGRQFMTVYTRMTLRNGAKSYTRIKDSVDADSAYNNDTVYTCNASGAITSLAEYVENIQETDLSKKEDYEDPFAVAAALPEDDDPFAE